MRRYVLLTVALLLNCILCKPVYAELSGVTDCDLDTGVITVSGNAGTANSRVTLQMINAENSWEELKDERMEKADIVVYMNQTRTDKNGNYGFSWSMPSRESAKYRLRVFSAAGQSFYVFPELLSYSGKGEALEALKEINLLKTSAEIQKAVEKNAASLRFGATDYAEALGESFWSNVLYIKNEQQNSSFAGVEALLSALHEAKFLVALNRAESESAIELLLENYNEYLALGNEDSYNLYSDSSIFSEQRRGLLYQRLYKAAKVRRAAEFKRFFAENTLILACCGNDSWYSVSLAIEKSALLAEYELPYYRSLESNKEVCKSLNATENAPESTAALAALIEKLSSAEKYVKKESSSGGGASKNVSLGSQFLEKQEDTQEFQAEFTDMEQYGWANEAVCELCRLGVINGRSAHEFAPQAEITREEYIKMVIGAMKIQRDGGKTEFEDVEESAWYTPYIAAGVGNGIINGVTDRAFGVGRRITRQDMAVIAYRTLCGLGFHNAEAVETDFLDERDISEYARTAVAALVSAEMINGTGDGSFMPNRGVNRASAAKLVYEMVKWRSLNE